VGSVSIFQLVILIVLLAPMVHVVVSDRSHGGAKAGWFLVVMLFSLLGYAVFLIVTQKNKQSSARAS
jgi:hypothetical protein